MPLPKSVCLEHFMWNCRICNQKNQQQAQTATISKDNAPPQTSSTSAAEAASPSKVISSGVPTESANPTPPVAASTSKTPNSLPVTAASTSATVNSPSVTATSSSSRNEAVQEGQKRKDSAATTGTPTSSSSSMPNKRLKVSNTIIDCEAALKVLRGINFFDTRFINSGKVLAWALEPDHPDFLRIHNYFTLTQYQYEKPIKILSILRIITAAHKMEDDTPLDFSDYPDASGMYRMMLWHGTPTGNVSSILENGFRVPSPNYGIYFADSVAKSKGYCEKRLFPHYVGYLFLCDVLLRCKRGWKKPIFGNIHCNSKFPPYRKLEKRTMDREIDGCIWPLAGAGGAERATQFLWNYYNDFVVYNQAQVQPKYLIKVEF